MENRQQKCRIDALTSEKYCLEELLKNCLLERELERVRRRQLESLDDRSYHSQEQQSIDEIEHSLQEENQLQQVQQQNFIQNSCEETAARNAGKNGVNLKERNQNQRIRRHRSQSSSVDSPKRESIEQDKENIYSIDIDDDARVSESVGSEKRLPRNMKYAQPHNKSYYAQSKKSQSLNGYARNSLDSSQLLCGQQTQKRMLNIKGSLEEQQQQQQHQQNTIVDLDNYTNPTTTTTASSQYQSSSCNSTTNTHAIKMSSFSSVLNPQGQSQLQSFSSVLQQQQQQLQRLQVKQRQEMASKESSGISPLAILSSNQINIPINSGEQSNNKRSTNSAAIMLLKNQRLLLETHQGNQENWISHSKSPTYSNQIIAPILVSRNHVK